MKKLRPGIYRVTNKINNKSYVGQSQNVVSRLNGHRKMLLNNVHGNQHLQNAWNKYGEENFEFVILEECTTNELNELEYKWMLIYDSIENGYNIRLDPCSNRGLKWSNSQREKMNKIYKTHPYFVNRPMDSQIIALRAAWEGHRKLCQSTDPIDIMKRKHGGLAGKGSKVKDTSKMKLAQQGDKNPASKLTEDIVKEIRYLFYRKHTVKELENKYDIKGRMLYLIKNNQNWKNVILTESDIKHFDKIFNYEKD